MSEKVKTYRPDKDDDVMIEDNDGMWIWRTDYEQLRTENERLQHNLDVAEGVVHSSERCILVLEKQLATQEKVIEKILSVIRQPRWLSIGAINNVAEFRISKETHAQLLATIAKGAAEKSVTMEPEK